MTDEVVYYKLGVKKHVVGSKKDHFESYDALKQIILDKDLTEKELKRSKRIIERSFSPFGRIIAPIILFVMGLFAGILDFQYDSVTSSIVIGLITFLGAVYLAFDIKRVAVKNKTLIVLEEILEDVGNGQT